MATINKKLIHFKSLSDFEARLAAGDVLSTSIVWIKDAKKIWTHGTYYDCNGNTESPFYITEFTLDNLRASSSEQTYYPCDAAAVCAALDAGKVILVPVWDGATGYVVAKVYYEDLLYWTIYDESLLQVFTFDTVVDATDIESVSVQTRELVDTSNVKTINGQSLLGSGDITISGSSGSYVPMSNTWYDSPSSVTIAPNSSVEIADLATSSIAINLTEPTDNSVVNTYTLIIRKFGFGNAFTFDKTIIWANDNAPVFDTTASDEFVEISIKRNFEGYYLGTWAKYSI